MSLEISMFRFNKKKNSTAKPDFNDAATYDCRIHSPCSIFSPSLMFNFEDTWNAPTYNYCYIDGFSRFYFIDDWTFEDGFWIASCSVDALTSWWDDLKETKQYVIRSASKYNTYITDLAYSSTTNIVSQDVLFAQDYYKFQLHEGTYVVGVLGKNDNSDMGAVTYVALSENMFKTLADFIFTPTALQGNLIDLSDSFWIKNVTGGVQDFLTFCKWFPFSPSDTEKGNLTNLTFGWYVSSFAAFTVQKYITKTFEITLPNHPQIARGKYLNSAPYTTRTIIFPPFGEIVLDSTQLVDAQKIECHVSTEMLTGESRLTIRANINGNNVIVATGEGNVAVNVQLANSTENYLGAATQVVTAAAGLSSASASAALSASAAARSEKARSHLHKYMLEKASSDEAIKSKRETNGAYHSIGDAVSQLLPTITKLGGRGSTADYVTRIPTLRNKFAMLVDDDNAHRGKPLCEDVELNTLEGFTVCADVEVQLNSTDDERNEIKSIMEGGFYIE